VTALSGAVGALRRARADDRVAAVLLYVDSPGGSALVSDLIHHEVDMLAREKPVVAFFANVAASGGYYVAAPARRIVAAPEAVTGSIGVISVKLVAQGLFERLRIRNHVVTTAPHADMFSAARPFDDGERALVEAEARAIYDSFLDVVARGRGQGRETVEAVAGGRVWSAPEALEHGLVDELGDFELALERTREACDLPPAQAPAATPEAWLGLASVLVPGPERALLEAAAAGAERVLCLSLTALRCG
jgi:protease-4